MRGKSPNPNAGMQNSMQDPMNMGGPVLKAALAINLRDALDGMKFPADRAAIRRYMEENEAGPSALTASDDLPDQIYENISDVINSLNSAESEEPDADHAPPRREIAATPGEFKASALESKRSLEDGRDD
jgi:hypothetical protein